MSDSASFLTSLLGKKAQLIEARDPHRAGAVGEIVCIHQDNGGNLRFTVLMEDGRLLCLHDDGFKVVR